jgi:hypothetical protein
MRRAELALRAFACHRRAPAGDYKLSDAQLREIRAVLDRGAAPSGDIWHHERGWAQ